jgi:hypothetical protein
LEQRGYVASGEDLEEEGGGRGDGETEEGGEEGESDEKGN